MSLSILKTRLAFQMTSFIMILNLLHLLGRLLVWEFIAGFRLFMFYFCYFLVCLFFKSIWNMPMESVPNLSSLPHFVHPFRGPDYPDALFIFRGSWFTVWRRVEFKRQKKRSLGYLGVQPKEHAEMKPPFLCSAGIYQQDCSNGDVTGGEAPSPWAPKEVPWWRWKTV